MGSTSVVAVVAAVVAAVAAVVAVAESKNGGYRIETAAVPEATFVSVPTRNSECSNSLVAAPGIDIVESALL